MQKWLECLHRWLHIVLIVLRNYDMKSLSNKRLSQTSSLAHSNAAILWKNRIRISIENVRKWDTIHSSRTRAILWIWLKRHFTLLILDLQKTVLECKIQMQPVIIAYLYHHHNTCTSVHPLDIYVNDIEWKWIRGKR